MNKILAIIVVLGVMSCTPKDELGELKASLSEKKTQLVTLQSEIKEISERIEVLSPTKKVDSVLVSTVTVNPTTFKKFATLQASVVADKSLYASSEIGGRLVNLLVKEGDYVTKGQVIGSVDLEYILKQKQEIESSLALARDIYLRQKNLWDQQIGSEIQYLQAKNNFERLEKSIETINVQIAKKNIYAPASGYVEREMIKAGEMTAPGSPIVEIISNSNLKVKADVPETYLTKVKKGDMVEIYLPAIDKSINTKISLLGRVIDPSNRTFKMEVDLNNSGNTYKPNLLAEVKIKEIETKNSLIIPVDYILEEVSGNKFVYTVETTKDGKKAKKSYVQLGESYNNNVVITSGLKPNDEVVSEGAHMIIEGTTLNIVNNN